MRDINATYQTILVVRITAPRPVASLAPADEQQPRLDQQLAFFQALLSDTGEPVLMRINWSLSSLAPILPSSLPVPYRKPGQDPTAVQRQPRCVCCSMNRSRALPAMAIHLPGSGKAIRKTN
jgi:hypothetical protein